MCRGIVINWAGLVKSSSGQLWVKRHGNVSGGVLEAREDSGSPRADSKSTGADGERNRANKIGCGELRKEPSERARGGGRPPHMGEYRLGSDGGARGEGVGSK